MYKLAKEETLKYLTVTLLGAEFICGRGVRILILILLKTITQMKASEIFLKQGCPDLTSVVIY